MSRSLFGALNGGSVSIPISLRSLDDVTMLKANIRYPPYSRDNIKRASCSHQHSTCIGPFPCATGHDGFDHISCAKTLDSATLFGFAVGKAMAIYIRDLTAPMSLSGN